MQSIIICEPLSYCFEETIGFDVKNSFARRPASHLIKSSDIRILRKGYSFPRDISWIENYKQKTVKLPAANGPAKEKVLETHRAKATFFRKMFYNKTIRCFSGTHIFKVTKKMLEASGSLTHFYAQARKKKSTPKKFLIFQELQFYSLKIKTFLYFKKWSFLASYFFIFQKGTFRTRKVKKDFSEKISYISGNGTFLTSNLKKLLYFRRDLESLIEKQKSLL